MTPVATTSLGDFCEITMGLSPKGDTYNDSGLGLPLLNGPTEFGPTHPQSTLFTTDSKRECGQGALIFCVRGNTTGKMNWADQTYSLGRGVAGISSSEQIRLTWARCVLESRMPLLLASTGGSTMPNLRKDDLSRFEVPLPRGWQIAAEQVSAIDDLIENNRRRIESLEEMARLLYREWFVHFRFPGHEDVEMVDSELRPIPEGWRVARLAELVASLKDGDWIETKDQGGSDYRLLQVSNIGLGSFRETGKFRYVTSETFERLSCTEIALGDVLVSRMPDPVGRSWLVDSLPERAITAVDVAILTPSESCDGMFFEQFLNSSETLSYAAQVATGTTRKRVSRSVLGGFEVCWPPAEQRRRFEAAISPAYELKSNLSIQNRVLLEARDLLLPRLVSGDLDVSDLDLDGVLA